MKLSISISLAVVAVAIGVSASPFDQLSSSFDLNTLSDVGSYLHFQQTCEYHHAPTNSVFNLKGLTKNDYTARDQDEQKGRQYTYYFSVCGNTQLPFGYCDPTKSLPASPAYQVQKADKKCFRLGSASPGEFALIDEKDPSKGISLTYRGGENCTVGSFKKERTFTINFNCLTGSEEVQARVEERNCDYTINFNSPAGCPQSCLSTGQGQVCSGAGICGYDKRLHQARCLCNSQRYGSDCSLSSPPADDDEGSCDTMCAILATVISLLSVLIIAIGAMLWRIHKLAQLNVKFERIDERPEEIQTFPSLSLNA